MISTSGAFLILVFALCIVFPSLFMDEFILHVFHVVFIFGLKKAAFTFFQWKKLTARSAGRRKD